LLAAGGGERGAVFGDKQRKDAVGGQGKITASRGAATGSRAASGEKKGSDLHRRGGGGGQTKHSLVRMRGGRRKGGWPRKAFGKEK